MKANVTKPNKKVFRVILAASAVLILCGAFCGAAAAEQGDLTATLSTNSIVEKVTIHDVDKSQSYGLKLTASSLLWEDSDVDMMMKSDLYIKPFKLEVTCNGAPMENAKLTVQFKVDKEKMEEFTAASSDVRLAHKKGDKNWELFDVAQVPSEQDDGYLHFSVTAQEPTSLFAIVVLKTPVKKRVDDNGTATPGEEGKMTIINQGDSPVSEVTLGQVSNLTPGDDLVLHKLSGKNPLLIAGLENRLPEGYISQKIISLFAVETKPGSSSVSSSAAKNPVMYLNVAVNPGYDPAYVRVIHFKNGAWEDTYLPSKRSGNTYEVTTDGFSPFAVVYAVPEEKPTPQPTRSSGSSTPQGSSIWLTAAPTPTVTPTPAPTGTPGSDVPQVKPVETKQAAQTGASPAPVMGVLAGLGCAAVLFGLRRK